MKKFIYIFILILFSLLIFFYFGKKSDFSDKNTVVFWTLQLSTFDKYINNAISKFEKENPDIKIKWIDIPYSEGEKRTLAAVLTDNPPDLVNLTPDFSLLLAQKNALQFLPENELEIYIPSLMQTLKYDEKYFGIPFYATSAVTIYNKRLASKLNIKQLPKKYDDLFKIEYSYPMVWLTMIAFAENDTLLKILNKYNINSYNTINSEKSAEIISSFKKLYEKNYLPKESIVQSHRDALEKYMSGQLVFLVTGANFLNMIRENAPSVYSETGILPQLQGDIGLFDYSLMNFVIPKKAHNKEAALKFALFLTNKDNQVEFAKLTSILPVNKEALKDEYFSGPSENDIAKYARKTAAEQMLRLQPPLNVKNKKELNVLSSSYIQKILINNVKVDEALNDFSKDWEKL